MRTTKGNVESAFKILTATMKKRIAESYNDVGAWRLDYVGCYGGYIIEEIGNVNGGVFHPLTEHRMKAEAFYDACWFAIRAMELKEKESAKVAV